MHAYEYLCAESRRYCCNFCSFRASTPNQIARHRCAVKPAGSSVALYRTVSTDMKLPTQASASASTSASASASAAISQTLAAGAGAAGLAPESDAESDSMQFVSISPSPAASPQKAAGELSPPAPPERSLFALTGAALRPDDDSLSQENPFACSPADAEHNSVSAPTPTPTLVPQEQKYMSQAASLQCDRCESFFPSQRSLSLHQRYCELQPATAATAATGIAAHSLCLLRIDSTGI